MVNFSYSQEYLGESKPINQITPLVSVCLPTFQHVEFIEKCLDSVLAQVTDFPFEILIGEDDSTDGTREICYRYADKYPDKIRLMLGNSETKMIRNGKKIGRLNHLNLYAKARGKFICICDGDDYWTNDHKLQLQADLLNKYPDASICLTDTFLEGQENTRAEGLPKEFKIFTPHQLKKRLYLGHISSWMIRNEMADFLKNEIILKTPVLDVVIFNFSKLRGNTIFTPELTSFYRLNPQGIYRKNSMKQNHKDRFFINWHLFIYVHKDPFLYLRTLGFMAKRYFINFIQPKVVGKIS